MTFVTLYVILIISIPMKKLHFPISFIFLLLFSSTIFTQTAYDCLDLKKLDEYIGKAREDWKIPGLSICIVKNDTLIYAKGFGIRDIQQEGKVDEHTVFAIASNTKAFTSAALSILADEGKISLDDRVIDHLPYFELYDPYVTGEMKIRDLLCHRSGLVTFSGDLLWYGSSYSREEVIRRAKYLDPVYGLREHYGYSNIMFLAAGEIIPAVVNMSWDEFLEQRFFDPLGMSRTNTSTSLLKDVDNVAMPHHVNILNGETMTIPYLNWDNIGPAGSINSSAYDMAQWIKLQLNEGKLGDNQIISKERIWEMRSVHTPQNVSPGASRLWPSRHFYGYGLGWFLEDYHGKKIVGHGGGADGMISKVTMVPEENLGFVVLTNSINSVPTALSFYILDMYFGAEEVKWSETFLRFFKASQEDNIKMEEEFAELRIPDTEPSLDLDEYTGTYGGEMYGNAEVVLEQDKLVVKFLPTPIFIGDLSHWHLDIFRIRLRDIPSLPMGTVQFIINAEGKVEEMRINIPNPDFDFTELEFKKIE